MEPANWIGIGVYYGATLQYGPATHVAFVLACLAIIVACLGFLAMRLKGKAVGAFPVVLTLGLLANAAAEVVVFAANDAFDHGLGGIMQVLGLAAIAFAVLRMDALGLQLPKLRNRAGSLAAVGLAALFITAQVAQNFLSDELGLLSGGIVAGAAVFAAYPLQKAAERAVERRPGTTAAAKYRRLVETAWTDGRLGANERLLLAESRRQLGLDAETASDIDDEVARRHAQPGGRPAP